MAVEILGFVLVNTKDLELLVQVHLIRIKNRKAEEKKRFHNYQCMLIEF
jgi:hypothetical protein